MCDEAMIINKLGEAQPNNELYQYNRYNMLGYFYLEFHLCLRYILLEV